ncbi:MAG: hypothetical protein WDA20_14145 [Desulfuromonadales bacterium]
MEAVADRDRERERERRIHQSYGVSPYWEEGRAASGQQMRDGSELPPGRPPVLPEGHPPVLPSDHPPITPAPQLTTRRAAHFRAARRTLSGGR